MFKELRTCFMLFVLLMVLTGLGYPFVMLVAGQALFPHQASGSLIESNGKIIGSELIGQAFTTDGYFHSRPSSAGNGYDASNSSGSNLGPTSTDLFKAIKDRVAELKKDGAVMPPVDLVTSSASGLDPDISPAAARFQAPRIANARHLELIQVNDLIAKHTLPRTFGIFGEPRVNVLALNRALDLLTAPPPPQP